jgi:hypothetical protein
MGQEDVENRLIPGERVVWFGQPATGLLLTSHDLLLVPFSLIWGGFAIFWELSVPRTNAPPFFLLIGSVFVLAGLYLVIGRFFVDAWLRANTVYAVTSRRILILRGGLFPKFTTLPIDRIPELSLDERSNGRGSIRFQPQMPLWANRGFSAWTPALDTSQFLAIADARSVFNQIQKLSAGTAAGF